MVNQCKDPEMSGELKLPTGFCRSSRERNGKLSEHCLVRSHIAVLN